MFTMRYIYISCGMNPLRKLFSSNGNIEFKDIFPWEISQMIMKTVQISTKIVISQAMKPDIPFWV